MAQGLPKGSPPPRPEAEAKLMKENLYRGETAPGKKISSG
jgi:hypothetical protein